MDKKVSSEGIKEGIIKIIDGEPYYYYKYTDYLYQELKKVNEKIDKAIEYINKQLEDTKQCLEYNRKQHNFFEEKKYIRDYNLYSNILSILTGGDEE